jgi:uncharacterized membrane protein YkvA (DUF1232 family)
MWQRARNLHLEVIALYLACREPRVPVYAKVFSVCVVGYAFSPIDLIPDFIPFVGQFDDLVIVPLGFLAARRMIPAAILAECRKRAQFITRRYKRMGWMAAAVIVAAWLSTAAVTIWMVRVWIR